MLNYNIDIFDIINSYLYVENIVLLTHVSKFFYNNINIPMIIHRKYYFEFDYFKELYIDVYKYNNILNYILHTNIDTLLIIQNDYFTYYKDTQNLNTYYNYFIHIIKNEYTYYFDHILNKIYIINKILPIINYIYKHPNIFCILYSDIINNKKTKIYTFDIYIINEYFSIFEKLYYIIQYNDILYHMIYN
jgi:hypothetical protein